jgi:hypothetical protein
MKTCSFEGCGLNHLAKGFCNGHYQQNVRGVELVPLRKTAQPGLSAEDYLDFWLDKSGDCWNWTGGKTNDGYGKTYSSGNRLMAHRLSYETYVGEIPSGMTVHHKCANRACCNPDHLELATQRDNMAEMFARKALNARIAELEARVAELEAQVQKAEEN